MRRGLIGAVLALGAGVALAVGGPGPAAAPAAARAGTPVVGLAATPTGAGYWVVDERGGISAFGDAAALGDLGPLHQPVVAVVAGPSGEGAWSVAADGGVFARGDVPFLGGLGGVALNQPVVAAMATPSGRGYWLVARDGGVFAFGDAAYLGSLGSVALNQPVVAAMATPSGRGYWLVARDGGVFAFGDAAFRGSLGSVALNEPIVGASAERAGGYRLVARDGGVFSFGAPFFGAATGVPDPVVAMAVRSVGDGYWVVDRGGLVRALGDAPDLGSLPPAPVALSTVRLAAEVVVDGLDAPTAVATRPGDDALFVTERDGRVRVVRGGVLRPEPVLTLPGGLLSAGGERGLLGLAFDAAGTHLYVHHTAADGDVVVAEYALLGDRVGVTAGERRELLRIEHSQYANHNGGDLQLGPDGYLYVAVGDGGGAGDPLGSGQDPTSLLGTVLRIDPTAPADGRAYAIPPDNPFVGRADAAPEIWAWGLRNPWRIAFDRATRDLWIADVGQGEREEIDLELAGSTGGRNYGWARLEGTRPSGGAIPVDAVAPLFEYPHEDGDRSVTGGRVYRGHAVPELEGAYLYGDFASGRVGALRQRGGTVVDAAARLLTVPGVVAFGEDADGELLAVRLSGVVVRIVRA